MASANGVDTAATEKKSSMPMFYEKPMPVDVRVHEGTGLKKDRTYEFAKSATALPVTLLEVTKIMSDYPMAFLKTADGVAPVAITGVRPGENLYVGEDGKWAEDTYVPAYVRRYPFILASGGPKPDQLTLCVDTAEGILEKDSDEPMVKDGKGTEFLDRILDFCRSFDQASRATRDFAQEVEKAGLLAERHAEIKLKDGKVHRVGGFMLIDEEKLRSLDDATVTKWHKNGYLGALYAILMSGSAWRDLIGRAGFKAADKA